MLRRLVKFSTDFIASSVQELLLEPWSEPVASVVQEFILAQCVASVMLQGTSVFQTPRIPEPDLPTVTTLGPQNHSL